MTIDYHIFLCAIMVDILDIMYRRVALYDAAFIVSKKTDCAVIIGI